MSTRRRVFNAVLTLLSLPLLLLIVLFAVLVASEGLVVFFVPLVVMAIALTASLAGSWVVEYRRAFWIEGTNLVRRRFGSDQRCDLATATVTADSIHPLLSPSIPRLIVAEPGSRPMTLQLRVRARFNRMLPPAELALLADAISSRAEMDAETKAVVDGLRAMARDPFGAGG